MKILIVLIGALLTGTIWLWPKPVDISGVWVMKNNERLNEFAILRIQMAEGYYAATLDLPAQQVYDKPVTVQMKNDSVQIVLDKNKECLFNLALNDSTMNGRSVVEKRSEPISFIRVKK